MSDLNRKPHTKAFFEKYKKLLEKFLDSWRPLADAKKCRWSPPGMGNGLMTEFIGEAVDLGSLILLDPDDRDAQFISRWLTARRDGKAGADGGYLIIYLEGGMTDSLRV